MAAIPGLRGSGDFGTDFRPTNYRELFTMLEPNGSAPLNALLAMAGNESSDDPKFNHFRDALPDRKFTVNGAVADTTTGSITVDAGDGRWATTGTLIVNATTGEVMRATSDGTQTGLTVERNIGGTSHTIADNAELFVAGSAFLEGSGSGTPISFDPSVHYNYTQIFKTSYSVTETLKNTYRRIGDAENEYAMKALKLHMSDIERAMFWGIRHEDTGGAQPIRYTGGILNFADAINTIDVSTFSSPNVMSEKEFDRQLIENVFAYGSKTKVAFCGASVCAHLMEIGKARWQPTQVSGGTYGLTFTRYATFAGDLMVYLHPQFRQVPGMNNAMVILDLPYVKYRYLDNRDTKHLENIQAPDEDLVKHQYLTECGLELTESKVHTYITGWNSIS